MENSAKKRKSLPQVAPPKEESPVEETKEEVQENNEALFQEDITFKELGVILFNYSQFRFVMKSAMLAKDLNTNIPLKFKERVWHIP